MHKCTNAQMHKCTNAQMHTHSCFSHCSLTSFNDSPTANSRNQLSSRSAHSRIHPSTSLRVCTGYMSFPALFSGLWLYLSW